VNTPLDYRSRSSTTGPSCGLLVLQTISGFFLSFMCLLGALALSPIFPTGTPFLVSYVCIGSFALALTLFLAYSGRPGGLIGFLIASSIIALLAITCGRLF
jgi:hypothetical protein